MNVVIRFKKTKVINDRSIITYSRGKIMQNLNKVLLIGFMLTLALLLTACGGTTAAEPAAPAEEEAAAPAEKAAVEEEAVAEANEKVVIEWWHIWANEANIAEPFQALANEYMAEHPNVEIAITTLENEAYKQKVTTLMQSNDPPDVFQSWGGGVLAEYANAGLVQDMTPHLAKDGWGDTLSEGAKALFMVNGKNYAVPWRSGLVGIWYNKELFAEAGIEGTPATWEELLADIQTLKDADITPIVIGEGEQWPGMFWYASLLAQTASPEEILAASDRTGSFDSPGYVAAGEYLEQLIATEPFQEGHLAATYADVETLFANNQAAMQLMGHWAYGLASTVAEDPEVYNNYVGWFPFPSIEGEDGDPTAILGGGDSFAIGVNAPPETIDFVRFLTSKEVHERLVESGAVPMPIIDGVEPNYPNPVFADLSTKISEATFVLNFLDHQFPPPLNTAVNEEVQKIFAEQATGADVAATLEELAVENLKN